jgi:hypothetical protein
VLSPPTPMCLWSQCTWMLSTVQTKQECETSLSLERRAVVLLHTYLHPTPAAR